MTSKRGYTPRRVDGNQSEIVKHLESIGASVQLIHTIGGGCPDLLVGYRGLNFLLEVKDIAQPPSKRGLTSDETKWHDAWRGEVHIALTPDDAAWYVISTAKHLLDDERMPF